MKFIKMSAIAKLVTMHNAMLTLIRNAMPNCNQHFIEAVAVMDAMEGQTQEPMLSPPCQWIFDVDDTNVRTDQNDREDFQ